MCCKLVKSVIGIGTMVKWLKKAGEKRQSTRLSTGYVYAMSKAAVSPDCSKDIGVMKDEIISSSEKKDGGFIGRLFDTLKRNSTQDSPTSTEPPLTYYGVYIPCEIKKGSDEEAIHVFKNKCEALELVKRYKSARFKAFPSHQEAVSFALRGAEPVDHTDGCDTSMLSEKPYPFKAPSPQEMVSLRKAIEAGLTGTVRDRVWDNPRYLVSSGSTPAILQEGSRYNALHVAAKALSADMCDLILTTVGNPAFLQTLYGADADLDACKEFAEILVDRYLNTPDKAMNETPLHFAAKWGGEGAVDVLTSFPQCDTTVANKFGETPTQVICKRAPNATPETAKRILALLEERYYVPVLHAEDGSGAPTIGTPFTPAKPPDINRDPLSPRYEIRAFAGPMPAPAAAAFRRQWKTPPRRNKAVLASPAFRLQEMTKGLEAVGRSLAERLQVGWQEYWPFLDTFTDLRSTEGMTLLENYLKAKYESACSFAYNDSFAEAKGTPEQLDSQQTLCLANDTAFLLAQFNAKEIIVSPTTSPKTTLRSPSTLSPVSELCAAMKSFNITERPAHLRRTDPIRQRMCRQPIKHVSKIASSSVINHTVSPLVCIERTCQVFAKRIADDITFSLTAEPQVASESLKAEARRLQHSIQTYMDDERFQQINFALTHSRLAQLVVHKLKQHPHDVEDVNNFVEFLIKLRCPNDDIFSSDDERKPENYRGVNKVRLGHVIESHVRCLASLIGEELTESESTQRPAVTERDCADIWARAGTCRCEWRVAGGRKNRSVLSLGAKVPTIRRLAFEQDSGDARGSGDSSSAVRVNRGAGDVTGEQAGDAAEEAVEDVAGEQAGEAALQAIAGAQFRVAAAPISEDESGSSESGQEFDGGQSGPECDGGQTGPECDGGQTGPECADEQYRTAEGSSDEDMHDATDRALAEPFIYGEEPSKMDRLVYECLCECAIDQAQYPNVYRWRHTVALYTHSERNSWHSVESSDESVSCTVWSPSPSSPGAGGRARSTPQRDREPPRTPTRGVPLQVSNWVRITGPNSPRAARQKKQGEHNTSAGL